MNREEVLDEVNVIYERVSNNENNLFSDGNYTEALEVLIDYYEVGVIEELEKIKAEVCEPNEMEYFENSNIWQKWFCDLIDKHISELKGE